MRCSRNVGKAKFYLTRSATCFCASHGAGSGAGWHSASSRNRVHVLLGSGTQGRNARTGSVPAARHAGRKHAASAATAITMKADPNASGSRGLTLYNRFPSFASSSARLNKSSVFSAVM